jgi:hypothetical protein
MKKIPSLFIRDWDNNPKLITQEITPGCEWVIAGEGVATRKWDGTAILIKEGVLYKRYDAKNGKIPPDGFIPCQEPDEKTGHWPGWIQCFNADPSNKYIFEAFTNTFGSENVDPIDGTYKPTNLYWEAWTEERFIVCIILRQPNTIQMREVIETVGHEYGHIINADDVRNSTESYDTPEGYKQEETKALWFEVFVHDTFIMTKMYLSMFAELGITKRFKKQLNNQI